MSFASGIPPALTRVNGFGYRHMPACTLDSPGREAAFGYCRLATGSTLRDLWISGICRADHDRDPTPIDNLGQEENSHLQDQCHAWHTEKARKTTVFRAFSVCQAWH